MSTENVGNKRTTTSILRYDHDLWCYSGVYQHNVIKACENHEIFFILIFFNGI